VSRRWRLTGALAIAAGVCATALGGVTAPIGPIGRLLDADGQRASALAAAAAPVPTAGERFAPELGLPATGVVAFGSSPNEAAGEIWAYGAIGEAPASVAGQEHSEQYALLERTDASGWQVVPLPGGTGGKPLAALRESTKPAEYGSFAGQATAAGGVILLSGQNVVVRDPHEQPRLAPAPPAIADTAQPASEEVLGAGESLLPKEVSGPVTLPYAAIEEQTGHTGVLIAPHDDGIAGKVLAAPGVLHYNGERWTREPIELEEEDEAHFTVLALACAGTVSSPSSSAPQQSCWLLASAAGGAGTSLLLFRRVPSEGSPSVYEWDRQPVSDPLLGEQTHTAIAPLAQGAQMLTATAQGVWVDFRAAINPAGSDGKSEFSDTSELVVPGAGEPSGSSPVLPAASVEGTWCYPTGPGCEHSLGAPLPAQYRSFAWSGAAGGVGGDSGTRVITGLPHRAMLELAGGSFIYVVGAGGQTGEAPGGAALTMSSGAQVEGLIADSAAPTLAPDGAGQSQAIEMSAQAPGDQLQEEAVPFRRPLYAVAQAPGTTAGELGAQAVAVGEAGQVGRYLPGVGWRSESLYDSGGEVQTPTLRGVAWPEPERAYAVGDNGAMWLWRAATGLWEPDPAKPLNFIGDLQAIAFSPEDPSVGYAVGRQGVLLKYGKSWEQVSLPTQLQQVNFTSIAFAGGQALATYRAVEPDPEAGGEERVETGGVAVEEVGDGEHWHVDPGVSALLAQLAPYQRVLSKVAGLSDGGAVAAGPGKVIERDSSADDWRFSAQPLPEAQNISALAAYRESGGPVRAVVSIDLDERVDPERFFDDLETSPFKIDVPPPTGAGQPPPFLDPDVLPNSGYLLRETASGWSDMEHAALPANGALPGDMPVRPDPVLALLVDPTGASGLAVGGETGDIEGTGVGASDSDYQTAAALRFPAGEASANGTAPVPIATAPGAASFVAAGQAACAQPECSDFANDDLGPDTWLTHALQVANGLATGSLGGLHAFLYTGGRLPALGSGEGFSRDLERYTALLGSGGSLPVYAADSSDLGPFVPGESTPYYAFPSPGPGGTVRVIVLDFASGTLGATQETWLQAELAEAEAEGHPAIVMGDDALSFALPDPSADTSLGHELTEASDAGSVSRILIEGHASAYFFDYPGANVKTQVSYGGQSIPAYGTGTLGYVSPPPPVSVVADSLGSSGFLLASVETAARNPATNIAPVSAEVVPNIAQLALDATDGVLLRRSQVSLFEALARRPSAGVAVAQGSNGIELAGPDLYDQIPFDCQGPNCAYEVPTEYTFTSSNPDIGNFVAHEAASNNPRQVELGASKLPVADPHSGLFCAFNEGTTTVSVTTGGLTYSEPVTVQGGSVQYPCGTVPLTNPPPLAAPAEASFSTPNIAPAGSPPASPQVAPAPLPPPPAPVSPAPPVAPPPAVHHPAPAPFLAPQPLPAAVLAIVPPLSPAVARPTPPSGTAQVFEPMAVGQREQEDESAEETASLFAAYRPDEGSGPGPGSMLALLVIAAGAGVGIMRRGPGRSSRRRARHAFARAGAQAARVTEPERPRATPSGESTRR
jgi:hypothetical protein